jgi:hypothetical protein
MRDRSGVTHVAVNATAEGCVAMLLRRYQDVSFPWWALGIKLPQCHALRARCSEVTEEDKPPRHSSLSERTDRSAKAAKSEKQRCNTLVQLIGRHLDHPAAAT